MLKKKIITCFLIGTVIFMPSCDLFDYHPYDGRVSGEKDINAKNVSLIETNLRNKKSFKFAMLSDTQRWYDETKDAVKHINQNEEIDFVVHCGDVADFGFTKEYIWQRDILNKLNAPYVVAIGNHDYLANGSEIFKKIFGRENFSFMAGNVKFVCIDTNALEHDYSKPTPDFQYIRGQNDSQNTAHQKTVFVMHARPFSEQFDNNVAEIFQTEINKFPNLLFCLNGHDHNVRIDDLFDDGIIYYGVSSINKRQYFLFTITEDNYKYEIVQF